MDKPIRNVRAIKRLQTTQANAISKTRLSYVGESYSKPKSKTKRKIDLRYGCAISVPQKNSDTRLCVVTAAPASFSEENMAIDLRVENPIPFKMARQHRLLRAKARNLRAVDFTTIFRWHLQGVRGVKLEAVRIGGTLCTTEEAITRFIERLSAPADRFNTNAHSEVARAHAADEKRLAQAGII